ncbi:septal ring factor EnvC (AmiA/AmiB activator) [Novosphingobium chloroacetimidivorans]|uniref:Septal ring factor EnvC (AmiA/AmiB activator) n=1 Tax=Novosphingobium chloroacetimidivorans TaxID=1428314 RepID=A0A7W7K7N5_9SPHN|nr:peptidoglycan DD-metalloendopeptidase family protein [Novosphingobium chloroacetimidivorans]MBB4857759.1 septal ring factor EnvC (AmiA/AmiB activator) [Novosphingobium chloroacetimidivorans]
MRRTRWRFAFVFGFLFAALTTAIAGLHATAQESPASAPADAAQTRRELAAAQAQGSAARARAEALEAQARAVTLQADRTAREAAALAARVQETEAQIAVQEARVALIAAARERLRARMAERQAPLVRLTAALQRLSRRPPVLALLRPGSLRELVTMRALLQTMLPEVERRTAALRTEIARARQLEQVAQAASNQLRAGENALRDKRRQLAAVEARQRLASRAAAGIASRESDRALMLAERARDLGDLIGAIGREGELRAALARLPGPIMRPPRPEDSRVVEAESFSAPPQGLPTWILPLTGRLVTGFGEEGPGGAGQTRSRGVVLATRSNAQAVAPAPGRIAYAGPYRGYGQIVIVEHDGGWVTLVTGLARLDVGVGEQVVAGSPLGTTGPGRPRVGVELRRNGEPVNPLQYLRSL